LAGNDDPRRRTEAPLAFETVHRGRVYEQVLRQIQEQIATGRLKPGDKLPPERDLAERFQVSRSSVRDAIRVLELMGLVRSRQGEGTVVREVSAELLTVPLSSLLLSKSGLISELLEVRRILEPPIAARAAERATTDEVTDLAQILKRQREKMLRGESAVEEDTEFHYAIAVAARNTVVRKVVDLLMDILQDSRSRSLDVAGRLQKSYSGHRRILRAIEQHDASGAESAMLLHLRAIESLIRKQT
jgi:GntR family transcriptional repressor for pyruvate dehydrogenase complex